MVWKRLVPITTPDPRSKPQLVKSINGIPSPLHIWFRHVQVIQIQWMRDEELFRGLLRRSFSLFKSLQEDVVSSECCHVWTWCLELLQSSCHYEGISFCYIGKYMEEDPVETWKEPFVDPVWNHWATELPNSGVSMLLVFLLYNNNFSLLFKQFCELEILLLVVKGILI